MAKHTETEHKRTQRITMPDEVNLSSYNRLDVVFTNGKDEIFNIQFRRETDGSAELAINIIGEKGEVSSAITLFDLGV
jgi:hypothetical protein